jgi:hypothetical protein
MRVALRAPPARMKAMRGEVKQPDWAAQVSLHHSESALNFRTAESIAYVITYLHKSEHRSALRFLVLAAAPFEPVVRIR